jgi:hypothetical protein
MRNLLKNSRLGFLCLVLLVAACGPDTKTLEIQTSSAKITISEPPSPRELVMQPINVNVITQENFQELAAQLQTDPKSVFLMMTPNDYESLASNVAELRRYIAQQAAIVQYYRNIIKTITTSSNTK